MNAASRIEAGDGAGTNGGTRIQSVTRAAQLLCWLAKHPEGATAKEIAAAQGLTLPTTYHLINTLHDQEFLARDTKRRYVFGSNIAVIAQAYLRGNAVSERLVTAVRDLAARTGETTYLADWGEHDIRVLASVEGSHIVRVAEVASGPYEHGHARANGKVLLAYAAPEVRDMYLRRHPLVALTDATIVNTDQLSDELERVRRRGMAYDEEEYAEGVCCLAAPLLKDGAVTASFGISVPTQRFKQTRTELAEILLEVIEHASHPNDTPSPSDDTE